MKRNYFVYNDDLKKETIWKSLLLGSTRVKTTAEKRIQRTWTQTRIFRHTSKIRETEVMCKTCLRV